MLNRLREEIRLATTAAPPPPSNEEVAVESIPADGTYYIAVGPYQNAKNTYQMTVVVTPQTQECQDDADEESLAAK